MSMMRKRLRTVYATTALLAIVSMIIPLMNFNANAQFDRRTGLPLTTMQTQTQAPISTMTEEAAPIATMTQAPIIPVLSATDEDGAQKTIPLKSTYQISTATLMNDPGFTLTENNMIQLKKDGELALTLTPPQGLVTGVTMTTMDGLDSVDLERVGTTGTTSVSTGTGTVTPTGNTFSLEKLSELPAGDEYIVTVKTDMGIGTELVNEAIIVFGSPASGQDESEYYGETINKYVTNKPAVNKIVIKITTPPPGTPDPPIGPKKPPITDPGPGPDGTCPPPSKLVGKDCVTPPNPDGTCPPPSTKQGDKCVQPPPITDPATGLPLGPDGKVINPLGDPAKPIPIGADGKCKPPLVIGESQPPVCLLPPGSKVFPTSALRFFDITPNGDVRFLLPGKSPIVLCPSVPIPGTGGSSLGPSSVNPNQPLRLSSCNIVSLPDGGIALTPVQPIPMSVSTELDCGPGKKFVNGQCEQIDMPKSEEQKCKDKDKDEWRWDEGDDRCEKIQKKSSGDGDKKKKDDDDKKTKEPDIDIDEPDKEKPPDTGNGCPPDCGAVGQ